MAYHYNDIEPEWITEASGILGYDIPLRLASKYPQRIMLAAVALAVGYHIGMAEAEREHRRKKENEH